MEAKVEEKSKAITGSAIATLTLIDAETVDDFIGCIALYSANKKNRCKNICAYMITSLLSFKANAFNPDKTVRTNTTLHIKDPRDDHTYGFF